jgi:hypothetical protein
VESQSKRMSLEATPHYTGSGEFGQGKPMAFQWLAFTCRKVELSQR